MSIGTGRSGDIPERSPTLFEAGDPEAIDVYLPEQDAQRALEDCLRDEPDWRGLLRVEEIEFSVTSTFAN